MEKKKLPASMLMPADPPLPGEPLIVRLFEIPPQTPKTAEELDAALDELLDYINGPDCFSVEHAGIAPYTHETMRTVESVMPSGKIVVVRQGFVVGALMRYWDLRRQRDEVAGSESSSS